MADYLNRDDVLEIFNDIHPLDYNTQAYLSKIEELPVIETDKWISTAERQPEESGAYLCRTAKRVYLVVNYSKRHNTWNAFDSENEPKRALEVTHWMPISEPPEVKSND